MRGPFSLISLTRITARSYARSEPVVGAILSYHGHVRSVTTKPAYEGHIPLNFFENAVLAVGSAVVSLVDPRRGGELTVEYISDQISIC